MSEPIDFDCPTCHAKAGRPCNPVWDHEKRIGLAGGGEHWTRGITWSELDPGADGGTYRDPLGVQPDPSPDPRDAKIAELEKALADRRLIHDHLVAKSSMWFDVAESYRERITELEGALAVAHNTIKGYEERCGEPDAVDALRKIKS
jgi:hypothetical protein